MPKASGRMVKYWLQDHDVDEQLLAPPILNQWYTLFDAEDVRLLMAIIYQGNDEAAVKDLQMRWVIDGTTYLASFVATNITVYYIYKDQNPSSGGTGGLANTTTEYNAAKYTDKRGHSFKVEMRITSALGTNQTLLGRTVRETLEET